MSVDTKLKELIINTLSPEQLPEQPSETEIYLVEDDKEYATVEELAEKQDKLTAGTGIIIDENNVISASGDVASVNGKTGTVVLTGEDISADVSELTDTIQGHLQTLHDNIKDIELFKFPNATIIGEPIIDHGQVSGFTANDYLQFPFILDLHNQQFVIDFCFTTGNDVTTQQNILDSQFGLALAIANGKGLMAISHNGTSWAGSVVGTLAIQPNTTYYARLSWNRINYKTELSTDGKTYVADMNFGSTQSPYPRTMFIGGCSGSAIGHTPHPFGGTINMNYAYLTIAGNVIWQGMDDAGLSTRADISLDNLDEFGQAKFDAKQNKLVAGANITIDEETNTISATGGGSSDIDNTTITTNASQQIQAVAVIDQNTGVAKTWTGTMAEYEAIVTKDPETEYIITDDIGGSSTVIGEITEDINDLKEHTVIEFQAPTAANNYTWYRKYADGWVEQGGINNTATLTYLIPMTDTNYIMFLQPMDTSGNYAMRCQNLTTTGASINTAAGQWHNYSWQVSGMAA